MQWIETENIFQIIVRDSVGNLRILMADPDRYTVRHEHHTLPEPIPHRGKLAFPQRNQAHQILRQKLKRPR